MGTLFAAWVIAFFAGVLATILMDWPFSHGEGRLAAAFINLFRMPFHAFLFAWWLFWKLFWVWVALAAGWFFLS